MIKTPDGMLPARPYVQRRHILNEGINSFDFFSIRSLDCWKEAFPNNEIDYAYGWRSLWTSAARSLGNGTDYRDGQVALELQISFENGDFACLGAGNPCDFEDTSVWAPWADKLISDVCGSDRPNAGLIGVVVDEDDDRSRPCLTMLVSGPRGAADAARAIRQGLADHGLNAGVAIRTVRNETVGVVKVTYLPELYLNARHSQFGIDWSMWSSFAKDNPKQEWTWAALFWCDFVIAAVEKIQQVASLMVDSTYFDFMRIVPLGPENLCVKFDPGKPKLANLMELYPHQFLFGPKDL